MSEETTTVGFTTEERETLRAVLDEIIPPGGTGTLPGAGEAGLAAYMERTVRETPAVRPAIVQGVAAAAALARRRGGASFAALAGAERCEVLRELESSEPAFIPTLMFYTYAGYYQDARVLRALGLEARPPHPQGHEIEPNDLTLLDPVRRRAKLYRE
jgi:hypothetical protein